MTRTLTALFALPLAMVATPAFAQPVQPDGWVTENGRVLHSSDPRPAQFAVHPATRGDWVAECENRLAAANAGRDPGANYEPACRAWLDYYERIGATAHGFDFDYAIPVTISTVTIPCPCPPPPAPPPPRHHPHRRTVVHDKRIRM